MQVDHSLHATQVFTGEFLEKEHPGIVDHDVGQDSRFPGTPREQLVCGIGPDQVLETGRNLYRKLRLQRGRGTFQFRSTVADQHQVVSPTCQLPGELQSHAGTASRNQGLLAFVHTTKIDN